VPSPPKTDGIAGADQVSFDNPMNYIGNTPRAW